MLAQIEKLDFLTFKFQDLTCASFDHDPALGHKVKCTGRSLLMSDCLSEKKKEKK